MPIQFRWRRGPVEQCLQARRRKQHRDNLMDERVFAFLLLYGCLCYNAPAWVVHYLTHYATSRLHSSFFYLL